MNTDIPTSISAFDPKNLKSAPKGPTKDRYKLVLRLASTNYTDVYKQCYKKNLPCSTPSLAGTNYADLYKQYYEKESSKSVLPKVLGDLPDDDSVLGTMLDALPDEPYTQPMEDVQYVQPTEDVQYIQPTEAVPYIQNDPSGFSLGGEQGLTIDEINSRLIAGPAPRPLKPTQGPRKKLPKVTASPG